MTWTEEDGEEGAMSPRMREMAVPEGEGLMSADGSMSLTLASAVWTQESKHLCPVNPKVHVINRFGLTE